MSRVFALSFASMFQKDDDGRRTEVETRLFKHSLDSLDVIYAHRLTASFLSTRFPDGVVNDRGYDARGCVCTQHTHTRAGWSRETARASAFACDRPLAVRVGVCALPAGGRRLSARRAA